MEGLCYIYIYVLKTKALSSYGSRAADQRLCFRMQKVGFLATRLMCYLLAVTAVSEPCHEKPAFCICEIKAADQLHGNHAADQCLCFRYIDSTTSVLP